MTNRLVSVGDDFTLPTGVKVADANLPTASKAAAVAAALAAGLSPKLDAATAATTYAAKSVETSKLDASQKGAASGVATLDAGSKVPSAQIPDLSGTYATPTQAAGLSAALSIVFGG